MKHIALSQGKYATVDEEDFEVLNQWKWSLLVTKNRMYAVSGNILMHRLLLRAPKGKDVDHKNGDGLDNRRENIRTCTHAQNMMNTKRYKSNKSGFKGVYYLRYSKKNPWAASIQLKGRREFLGLFPSKERASEAYNEAALKGAGEFARI